MISTIQPVPMILENLIKTGKVLIDLSCSTKASLRKVHFNEYVLVESDGFYFIGNLEELKLYLNDRIGAFECSL